MWGGLGAVLFVKEASIDVAELARRIRSAGVDLAEVIGEADVAAALTDGRTKLLVLDRAWPESQAEAVAQRFSGDPATADLAVVRLRPGEGADGLLSNLAERLIEVSRPVVDLWAPALDGLAEGLIVVDAGGRIRHHNRAAEALLGTGEPLAGRLLAELLPVNVRPRADAWPPRIGGSGSVEWTHQGRGLRATYRALQTADGTGIEVVMLILDVTEANQLRERVVEAESARLASEARIAQLEHEARVLQQFAPEQADERDRVPLRASDPDLFCDLMKQYDQLLDLSLQRRGYQVENPGEVSARLRSMAGRLGSRRAGPRDVIEIHATCLRRKGSERNARYGQSLAEEGRLLVLELMGHLAAHYCDSAARAAADPPRKATG